MFNRVVNFVRSGSRRNHGKRPNSALATTFATSGGRKLKVDFNSYRDKYSDCRKMSDAEILNHFEYHGISEGRVAHPLALRENFLSELKSKSSILEIGPFCNPGVSGGHVKYFEILDQAALIERAKLYNLNADIVPMIHFLSPEGDLSIVKENFQCCFSSHVIEHQPDFIRHLQEIEKILLPEGEYCLLIPDHRYCFDHFITPSTVADVFDAFERRKTKHDLRSVIEHRALTTHNDPLSHWLGNHGPQFSAETHLVALKNSLDEFKNASGKSIDVHAWQFTPDSFFEIVSSLNKLGLLGLKPSFVNDTPYGRFEFSAVLKK